MKSAAEFTAAFPEPHVILGLRLLPLSLGRYRLLKRFSCPFVDDGEIELQNEDAISELFFALIICGLGCAEFKQLVENGRLARECKRFGKRLRKIIRRESEFNIFQKIQQFKKYLDEGTAMPWKVLPRSGNEGGSIAHWSYAMEVMLRSKVGWTVQEIDEEPMTKALCDFFKFMESEGSVVLISHEDFANLESHAESNADAFLKHLESLATN